LILDMKVGLEFYLPKDDIVGDDESFNRKLIAVMEKAEEQ